MEVQLCGCEDMRVLKYLDSICDISPTSAYTREHIRMYLVSLFYSDVAQVTSYVFLPGCSCFTNWCRNWCKMITPREECNYHTQATHRISQECGDEGSEQRCEQDRSTTKNQGQYLSLIQVCKHKRSSCFVDVVASHARLDTEVLQLSSSLVQPDSFQQESVQLCHLCVVDRDLQYINNPLPRAPVVYGP